MILDGKNLCNPGKFMRHRKLATNKVTHSGLLSLKNGVVWVGCPDPNCKTEIAIKKCQKHEFDTQKALNKEYPKFVPNVYDGSQCSDGFYMYSEYVKGGSLKSYKTHPKLEEYVYKVLLGLKVIHIKHPSFRHNDLHVDNVLMRGDQPLIYDFEFANWRGNPMFDAVFKRDYGIYVGNHSMYDFHFFINSVVAEFPDKFKAKALSIFPPEYIGENSTVIKNWRLRSDVSHKDLPTMDKVLDVFQTGPKRNLTKPRVMTFSDAAGTKKTRVNRSPPKPSSKKKATAANREKIRNMKAFILRNNPNMTNVEAELMAIKKYSPPKKKSPAPVPAPKKKSPTPKKTSPPKPKPNVTFTSTPRRRPRIGAKLCTSYKKPELMVLLKRLGHRVDSRMTLKEMCAKLVFKNNGRSTAYKRPVGSPIIDARKKSYEDYLKKNLFKLAKNVGVKVTSSTKKGDIVNKIRSKLNKNISDALKGMNKSTVTARQISEKLAKNYGWKNDRHVERTRLLKIYGNTI